MRPKKKLHNFLLYDYFSDIPVTISWYFYFPCWFLNIKLLDMFTSSDKLLNIKCFLTEIWTPHILQKSTALPQEKMSSTNSFTKFRRQALQLILFGTITHVTTKTYLVLMLYLLSFLDKLIYYIDNNEKNNFLPAQQIDIYPKYLSTTSIYIDFNFNKTEIFFF